MRKRIDLTNKIFGRLTVTSFSHIDPTNKGCVWLCICICGRKTKVRSGDLISGSIFGCGCMKRNNSLKHGHSINFTESPTYRSWHAMISRCTNPKKDNYKDYGGRGIVVCKKWLKFENFLKDMGERPIGKTLDRIDNDGNYCKSNCKWSTPKEQANNRRTNIAK